VLLYRGGVGKVQVFCVWWKGHCVAKAFLLAAVKINTVARGLLRCSEWLYANEYSFVLLRHSVLLSAN